MKFLKRYHLKDYKFNLIILIAALSIFGVFVVGSAKKSVQNKQILGVIIGFAIMLFISFIDYVWVLNFYWIIYAANLIFLIAVRFFGTEVNGARRWIDIGFTNIQPSELAKLLLILFFAKYLMIHQDDLNTPKTLIKTLALAAVPLILILKQPALSTTISITVVFCILLYVSGLSYKIIGTAIIIIVPTFIILLSIVVQPDQKILDTYQQTRILAWLEPTKYEIDEGYQQKNSIMAIGSGQLQGKGLNNNTTTSVKNGNFILEPQTDFIFAIIGEELGFVGCCVVISLLLLVVIQCILIGIKAQDLAGQLICCGVGAQIGVQTFINIAVATGLFPNTGIPLPFISYGLSSLVSMFMSVGFVLNIGLKPKKYQ